MKKTISFILVMVLTVLLTGPAMRGTADGITSLVANRETPIAKSVPTDEKDTPQSLQDRLAAVFGEDSGMEFYESEESYIAAQGAYEKTSKTAKSVSEEIAPEEEVLQTFMVMDWKRKTPVNSAVILIDGVPRYTNHSGEIKVRLTKGEYVEVRVQKKEYVSYIEMIEVTGTDKTIQIKKPEDDIEISGVMLTYGTERVNLLTNAFYLNIEEEDYYGELQVECNVPAEKYILVVNGEYRLFSDDGIFDFFDATDYRVGDRFEIEVRYEGLQKRVPLLLSICSPKIDLTALQAMEHQGENVNVDMDTGAGGIGSLGSININPTIMLVDVLIKNLNYGETEIGPLHLSYFWDHRRGRIVLTLGINISIDLDKDIRQAQKEIKEAKKKRISEDKQLAMLNAELVRQQYEVDNLKKQVEQGESDLKSEFERADLELDEMYQKYRRARKEHTRQTKLEKYKEQQVEYGRQLKKYNDYHRELVDYVKEVTDAYNRDARKNEAKRYLLMKKLDKFKELIRQPQKIKSFYSFNNGFDLDFDFIGAMEFSTETGNLMKVNIAAGVALKYTHTFSTVIVVVPCFLKLQANGGIKLELAFQNKNENKPMTLEEFIAIFQITVELGLRIDVGIGISGLLSIAAFGGVDFEFGYIPLYNESEEKSPYQGRMYWNVGIRLEVLFFKHDWAYRDYINLYGENKNQLNAAYAEKAQLMARSDSESRISERQLFDRVYQSAKPRLTPLSDGRQLLTWLSDDAGRDAYNRTVLTYSVFDGERWSTPAAVYDDGKADFYPDVYSDGTRCYIAWQKSNAVFDETTTPAEMLRAGEICVSEFDAAAGTFGTAVKVTTDGQMDASPVFALPTAGEEPALVWQSNSEGDYLGTTGENEVYYCRRNGSAWGAKTKLYAGALPIKTLSATADADTVTAAIVLDEDGDPMSSDGRLILADSTGAVQETAWTDVSGAEYLRDGAGATLSFYRGGALYTTEDGIEATAFAMETEDVIPSGYTVETGAHGTVIFYEKLKDDVRQAYCSLKDPVTGEWIHGIALTDEKERVYNTRGYLDADGTVRYVYNVQTEDGSTALCYGAKRLQGAIGIENAYFGNAVEQGKEVVLHVQIANTGDYGIDEADVTCFGQTKRVTLTPTLAVGETRFIEATFGADELRVEEEIRVEGIRAGARISSATTKIASMTADVRVGLEGTVTDGKQRMTATIRNEGKLGTDVEVKVYVDGKEYRTYRIRIESGEEETLAFGFDEIAEGDYVRVAATPKETDRSYGDNAADYLSVLTEDKDRPRINPYEERMRIAKAFI